LSRRKPKKTSGKSGAIFSPRQAWKLPIIFKTNSSTPSSLYLIFPAKDTTAQILITRDVLFFSVYQYMIVYRRAATVEIVAVLHGKRDLRRLLKARLPR
jgi:hypothetical protein